MKKKNYILKINKLEKFIPYFSGTKKNKVTEIKAVDGVDLDVIRGEMLGVVGESGCGKSTLGRTILRITEPTKGKILYHEFTKKSKNINIIDITSLSKRRLKYLRKDLQIIFQNPYSSLNPRMKIKSILLEPFQIHGLHKESDIEENILSLIDLVGLKSEHLNRYPFEFSGGQRQRIGIARALALKPKLIVADEAVSSLDVSVQAQIVNLMKNLQIKLSLTYIFISHNLSLVKYICDRVAVMYLGKIVEIAKTDDIFNNPKHPYTEALLSSVPKPNPSYDNKRIILKGEIPDSFNKPTGCQFHTRCRYVKTICTKIEPYLKKSSNTHYSSCHFSNEIYFKGIN